MKKKNIIGCILAVFLMMTVSFVSVLGSETAETKESPLYKIRTKQAISEKIGGILENIKTKFIGERILFKPIELLIQGMLWTFYDTATCYGFTCSTLCESKGLEYICERHNTAC